MKSASVVLVIAPVLAALAGTAGCSTNAASSELPYEDRYLRELLGYSTAEDRTASLEEYLRVEQGEISLCMSGAGFDYVEAPPKALYVPSGLSGDPIKDASKYGFGISLGLPPIDRASHNPNDDIIRDLTTSNPTQASAWQSQLSDCSTTAQQTAELKLGMGKAASTADLVRKSLTTNLDVVAATDRWSSCLEGRGFLAESPDLLVEELTAEWQSGAVNDPNAFRAKEIAAASASLECGEELRAVISDASQKALMAIDAEAAKAIFGES